MISVVVPVLNGGDKFRKCIAAVSQTNPPPSEIVVVNDGGTEDLAFAQSEYGARVIDLDQTGGPARARNAGALATTGDIIFFVDADVVVRPNAVEQVATVFEREPDVSAVFGSYDDQPAETDFLSQYRNLLHHYVHQQGNPEAGTFWGACGAIRRNDFDAAGGFDEDRYSQPSIEDVELGYRLKRAGKRIRLLKSLQVQHLKQWTAGSILKTDFFQRAVPWSELILGDGHILNDLNTSVGNRLSVLLTPCLILTAIAGLFVPPLFLATIACSVLLLILNLRLYAFFRQKRGLLFAIKTVPWHWLQLLMSGIAFGMTIVRFALPRTDRRETR